MLHQFEQRVFSVLHSTLFSIAASEAKRALSELARTDRPERSLKLRGEFPVD